MEFPEFGCRAFPDLPKWPACSKESFLPLPEPHAALHPGRIQPAKGRVPSKLPKQTDACELFLDRLVNDVVARGNRGPLRNAVGDDICDRGRGFDRRDPHFADKLGAPLDEKLRVVDHPVLVSKTQHHKIPCRVHREDSALKTVAHLLTHPVFFLSLEGGQLGACRVQIALQLGDERLLFRQLSLLVKATFGRVGRTGV